MVHEKIRTVRVETSASAETETEIHERSFSQSKVLQYLLKGRTHICQTLHFVSFPNKLRISMIKY